MSDYLIWVAENLEKDTGISMEIHMRNITEGARVPDKYSIKAYIKEFKGGVNARS